jgi:hypothetical protein
LLQSPIASRLHEIVPPKEVLRPSLVPLPPGVQRCVGHPCRALQGDSIEDPRGSTHPRPREDVARRHIGLLQRVVRPEQLIQADNRAGQDDRSGVLRVCM